MNENKVLPRAWWLWWALATTFGWAVVMPMSYDCSEYGCYSYEPSSAFLLFLPILLAAIGQGYLLRNRLKGIMIFWILITGVGYSSGLGFVVADPFDFHYLDFGPRVIAALILGGILGVGPALGQFLFLSKLPKSGWWILVGTLSFSVSMMIFHFFAESDEATNIFGVLFGGVLVGAAFGIPTGILMHYLLDNAKTHTIKSGDQP